MTTSRLEKGWGIFQKKHVALFEELNGLLTFKFKGSDHQVYTVSNYEDDWNCECHDFRNRHMRHDQCFMCKHIYAACFELGRIKGVNQQKALNIVPEKVTA